MRASASTLLGLPLLLLALSSAPPASGRLLKDSRSAPDASFLLRVLMELLPSMGPKAPKLPFATSTNTTEGYVPGATTRGSETDDAGILGSRKKKKCKGDLVRNKAGICACKEGFYKKKGTNKCVKKKQKTTTVQPSPKPTKIMTPKNTKKSAAGEDKCSDRYGADQCKMIQEILDLTNELRARNGKDSLCLNDKLIRAAKVHTEDMVKANYFDHTGSDGSSPWDRMDKVGFKIGDAENVAFGQYTAQAVFDAWNASPGHKANMLGSHNMMGAWYDSGKWTQTFGSTTTEKCIADE